MNQPVDVGGFLVNLQETFVLQFLLVGRLRAQNHLHRFTAVTTGLLIVIEFLLDAVEVEVVADEFVVDLAEELVVFEVAEPLDPAAVGLLAVLRFLRHQI